MSKKAQIMVTVFILILAGIQYSCFEEEMKEDKGKNFRKQ